MNTELPPSISKRALGEMLFRLRERAGYSRGHVAAYLGKIDETLRRWEVGTVAPNPSAIRDLARYYGASDEELARMTSYAANAKQRGLFEGPDVPADLRYFIESEAAAKRIDSLELEHIPGLLQTLEYHQVMQAAQLAAPPEKQLRVREIRPRRQKNLFERDPMPEVTWIIGPAAFVYLRSAGDEIAAPQIARLREVSVMPSAEIRVITQLHPGMLGAFTIITPRSSSTTRPFVYIEGMDLGRYIETADVVSDYQLAFRAVREKSIPLEEYLDAW